MLNRQTIEKMGFLYLGENVQISDCASFYGISRIKIGNNTRIDDFCTLAAGNGGIDIGNNVHIANGCTLIGAGKISMADFSGLSSRVAIYSSSDDYSGAYMTNPTVPAEFTNVTHADVRLGKHVIVGSGSVILPGVILEDGVAVGSLSLINRDCHAFGIYAGNPARRIKERSQGLLEFEVRFINSRKS